MKNIGGRPKKHSTDEQRVHARCFLDIKKREPKVTQEQYAQNYGFSGRTLRRYIERHFPLEAIELKEQELRERKKQIIEKNSSAKGLDSGEPRRGLLVAWT